MPAGASALPVRAVTREYASIEVNTGTQTKGARAGSLAPHLVTVDPHDPDGINVGTDFQVQAPTVAPDHAVGLMRPESRTVLARLGL